MIDTVLETSVFANTPQDVVVALGITLVAFAVTAILQKVALARLERWSAATKNRVDDAVIAMVRSVNPPFYWVLALYLGARSLLLPEIVNSVFDGVMLAVIIWYAIRALSIAINMVVLASAKDDSERQARKFLAGLAKGVLWALAGLLLLSNLGINITSLVAGLGIGGIAVAFALQNILADLFSSFAIHFDKPFEIGDFIIVGADMGTVERVGIKTTRLRALQGEEIVISNQELTSARIQNFKKMAERRVAMRFGILYETPKDVLAALSAKIHDTIDDIKGIRVDRVHFAGFGDSSLDFEIVYYVTSADYNEYMDRQQEMNLALVDLFEKEKVGFAYPTRTVYTIPAKKP